ncbi:putative HAUS augmin-like complex subunit 5 [Apostichopus japonicus]|uniref:Putative HAUS augmin-like complex subunit 5 n=1 Tax=Stichopus japonicus TaxID=307972 RepID=A0A2G8L1S6_STIJA|nr:putative HAUS augmin-like complex subunit 5 [Apostichopus japonicus]
MDRKQSLIQVLITENLNSRKQLEETRRNIGSYIQKAVCEHEAGTVAMATSLKDSSAVEISAFHGLSLEMLHQTQLASGELKPTNQLSISRFNNTSPALGGDALMRIQTALHFPPYLVNIKIEPSSLSGLFSFVNTSRPNHQFQLLDLSSHPRCKPQQLQLVFGN